MRGVWRRQAATCCAWPPVHTTGDTWCHLVWAPRAASSRKLATSDISVDGVSCWSSIVSRLHRQAATSEVPNRPQPHERSRQVVPMQCSQRTTARSHCSRRHARAPKRTSRCASSVCTELTEVQGKPGLFEGCAIAILFLQHRRCRVGHSAGLRWDAWGLSIHILSAWRHIELTPLLLHATQLLDLARSQDPVPVQRQGRTCRGARARLWWQRVRASCWLRQLTSPRPWALVQRPPAPCPPPPCHPPSPFDAPPSRPAPRR